MKKKYIKKLKKNKFYFRKRRKSRIKGKKRTKKNKFKLVIKLIILLISIILINISNTINNENNLYINEYNITSDKWIIMTVFNRPTKYIINLEKTIKNEKIVVIGNNKTIDSKWDIFKNSNNLIYLSIKVQKKLGYKILKFISDDSYYRKNIGYLFAIQHGAKEIYEIDEYLKFYPDSLSFININNSHIIYGKENHNKMINPYAHFGEPNIWPRGFVYKDINIDHTKTFYYAHYSKIKLKPMVYQGLINRNPDVDSLFILTNLKINRILDINFSKNYPLLYLPGNYVPINSKNTKFSYEVFPFLMLPMTANESISDIIRGYILEIFVHRYNGLIVYHNNNVYNKNNIFNNSNILEEKEMLLCVNKILDIIKSNENKNYNSKKLLFKILNELIENNHLQKRELEIYKAFLKDLRNIGYIYTSKFGRYIKNNFKKNLNIIPEFIYYIPTNQRLLRGENDKYTLMKHSYSNMIYNDILLIINYNTPGFLKLNPYLEKLYNKYFPNIVFIYPDNIKTNISNIFSCTNTDRGSFSYKCIQNIYKVFPNYKGYLFTNDDNYMKPWEFQNLNFSIPWIYIKKGEIRSGDYFLKNAIKYLQYVSKIQNIKKIILIFMFSMNCIRHYLIFIIFQIII